MSDQCKSCEYKGKLKRCEQADCHHHENWYAKELKARVVELEKVVDAAKKNMSFDAGQYIYDKECGNLVDRNPDTLALLESLYNLNQPDKG